MMGQLQLAGALALHDDVAVALVIGVAFTVAFLAGAWAYRSTH